MSFHIFVSFVSLNLNISLINGCLAHAYSRKLPNFHSNLAPKETFYEKICRVEGEREGLSKNLFVEKFKVRPEAIIIFDKSRWQ